MVKRKLVPLLSLSFWCLVVVVRLFIAVPCVCLQFVIVVFPDHFFFWTEMTYVTTVLKSIGRMKCSITTLN